MLRSLEGKHGLPVTPALRRSGRPLRPADAGGHLRGPHWVAASRARGQRCCRPSGRNGRKGLRLVLGVRRVVDRASGARRPASRSAASSRSRRRWHGPGAESLGLSAGGLGAGVPARRARPTCTFEFGALQAHGLRSVGSRRDGRVDQDCVGGRARRASLLRGRDPAASARPAGRLPAKAVALAAPDLGPGRCWRGSWPRRWTDASICGLGQAAGDPIRLVMKHFADEIS